MPKKPARNSYYYFMVDYKERYEARGHKFPNGMRDVQELASPEWNNMTKEQKKIYEDMAKAEKARLKGDDSGKVTCLHRSFSKVDKERAEEQDAIATMIEYITTTVKTQSSKKDLAEYKWYLIHINYFCITEGNCYHPAEIAISEFSLSEGVTNVYHRIINPGKIPLGYRHEALQKSESTHKIPLEDNNGECDFRKIFLDIKKFLQPGKRACRGEYPPLFTMPDNVHLNTSTSAVKSVMNILLDSVYDSDLDGIQDFRIYSLDRLFLVLQNQCCCFGGSEDQALVNVHIARNELEKDIFNFTQSIACPFHIDEDVVSFCSKSYVQRWVYLICDFCIQPLGITPIPGRHIPENADVDYQSRRARELEEEGSKSASLIQSTKTKASGPTFFKIEQAPLPRPTVQANLAALLPQTREEAPPLFDSSENSFPSIPVGVRGRGRNYFATRGSARGASGPISFADAMKKK